MENKNLDYYADKFDESKRHEDIFGILQAQRTKELISRFITSGRTVVADIGGATGIYSFFVAELGHEVDLMDLVPDHIEKARKINSEKEHKIRDFFCCDARELPVEDETYDSVIVHGPLYHLVDKNERLKVLKEAFRVLKNDGLLLSFGINRYAGLFYALNSGMIMDDQYYKWVKDEINTGIRINNAEWYYHLPQELENEMLDSGFSDIESLGVTGPVWMTKDIERLWNDKRARKRILELSRSLEHEAIIGPDILCIGRK